MDLIHKFSIPVSTGAAWDVLTDLQRLADCMPGASLTSDDGDRATGTMKVKMGAITSKFEGALKFVQREPDAGRFVVSAEGRDVANRSTADARITVQISPDTSDADSSHVEVVTKLRMVGRVAQFGQGMLQDVSESILSAFLTKLEQSFATTTDEVDQPNPNKPRAIPRRVDSDSHRDDDVLDIGALAGPVMLSRLRQPLLIGGLAGLLGWIIFGQRRQLKVLEQLARAASGR